MSELIYNLPAAREVKEGDTPVRFPKPAGNAGLWRQSQGSLADLADTLPFDEKSSVAEVKSVPDAWLQPRTFADAITRERHPQGLVSISQWRGLLALFALETAYKDVYTLSLQPVNLKASLGALARILRALPPKMALRQPGSEAPCADWTEPVLVQMRLIPEGANADDRNQEKPITLGVMNPVCLVSAGRTIDDFREPRIEWMREGLTDPTELKGADRLSDIKLGMIRDYVQHLINDLDGLTDSQDKLARKLRGRLGEYRDALPRSDRTPFTVLVGEAMTQDRLSPIYAALRRSVTTRVEDPVAVSECLIELRGDLPPIVKDSEISDEVDAGPPHGALRGVILVDPEIGTATLKKPANNVHVWGETTLSALADQNVFRSVREEAAARGYLLVRPDQLFTPVLALLEKEGTTISGNPENFKKAPVPLTPLALLLFEPRTLAENVSLTFSGGSTATVSLNVNLQSAGRSNSAHDEVRPRPVVHTAKRTYADQPNGQQGTIKRDVRWTYSEVSVWPNFSSPDWTHYFARFHYPLSNMRLRGRVALSGSQLAALLSPIPLGERSREARTWLANASVLDGVPSEPVAALGATAVYDTVLSRWQAKREGTLEVVQKSRLPYEAVFCTAGDACGLMLLAPKKIEGVDGARATVGMDFGTTNTVACIDSADRVIFEDRLIHPVTTTDPVQMNRNRTNARGSFLDFLPATNKATPTASVSIDRTIDKATLKQGDNLGEILQSQVVYFHPHNTEGGDTSASDIQGMRDILGRAHFNLKWDKTEEGRLAAQRFLRQLTMMIAAEALAENRVKPSNIIWRFSRPDAMSASHGSFRAVMTELLKEVVGGDAQIDGVYSEAEAAGLYVLRGKNSGFERGTLNIILDIGGGTTDVTIWKNDTPIWKGSYTLAGGHFFTQYIVNNPKFLSNFDLPGWAKILEELRKEKKISNNNERKSTGNYVGELLFSGPALSDAMSGTGWINKEEYAETKGLVHSGLVFLGGIAFYLGLVVRELISRGVIAEPDLKRTTFALCGRGAGLFAQLHRGPPDEDTRVSQLLTLFEVSAGVANPRRPQVFRSDEPKLEVAKGMAMGDAIPVDGSRKSSTKDVLSFEPTGMGAVIGSNSHGATDSVDLANSSGRVSNLDFTEFDAFITALAEHGALDLDLEAGDGQSTRIAIINGIDEAVEEIRKPRRDDDKAVPSEPLFIIALRELLEKMTAVPGDSRLRVRDKWS